MLQSAPVVTTLSPGQHRIQRAEELAAQHPFAKEILAFYVHLAHFQQDLTRDLRTMLQSAPPGLRRDLTGAELSQLSPRFASFLALAESRGPLALAAISRELHARGPAYWSQLLASVWASDSPTAPGLLALAFLQPHAELLRSRAAAHPTPATHAVCPFCHRKPVVGVLRQMGDGAARSLVCSFCLAEWDFRRLVCPACAEENDQKLPLFTASDFDYIRIDCCETCKTYLKSIDLTKNGHANPIVDDLASAPLDLWARDRGYARLHNNLLGM
jgi:formate dehydrogenase accessory protein FdhE